MAKKVVYKKKKIDKKILPHFYRIFTALSNESLFSIFGFLLFLSLILTLSIISLLYFLNKLKQERVEVLQRLSSAQEVIKKHPERAEAYYTAAVFAIQVKDYETAREYLLQSVFLNPEMNEAKELLNWIGKK